METIAAVDGGLRVRIISHRGYWKSRDEQNRPVAFERSLELGFGIETDLRDHDRAVVISHDPPGAPSSPDDSPSTLSLDSFLALCVARGPGLMLALNIKADGLQAWVREALDRHEATANAFVFDMSVPDTLGYLAAGVPVYVRHSDVEPDPVLYDRAAGVWLDQFHSDWIGPDDVARHLDSGKAVCLVSPELHRRDHRAQWERLAARREIVTHPHFLLCSDYPEAAREFFNA